MVLEVGINSLVDSKKPKTFNILKKFKIIQLGGVTQNRIGTKNRSRPKILIFSEQLDKFVNTCSSNSWLVTINTFAGTELDELARLHLDFENFVHT